MLSDFLAAATAMQPHPIQFAPTGTTQPITPPAPKQKKSGGGGLMNSILQQLGMGGGGAGGAAGGVDPQSIAALGSFFGL